MKIVLLLLLSLAFQLIYMAPLPPPAKNGNEQPPTKKPKMIEPRCLLFLSEANFDFHNAEKGTLPFIELSSHCVKRPGPIPKNVFSPYKVVIVQENPLSVVSFIDLQHFNFNVKRPYIVLGSPRVENVDISMSSPEILSSLSRTEDASMLPNPSSNTYSVILIRDISSAEARSFQLPVTISGQTFPRMMTKEHVKLLTSKAVDAIVLKSGEEVKTPTFIKHLWETSANIHGPLFSESWKGFTASGPHSSFSVCKPEYNGFDASAFIVAEETPGMPNECGTIAAQEPEQCSPHPFSLPDYEPIHKTSEENRALFTDRTFDPTWIEQCEKHFPKREKILEDSGIQSWLKFGTEPRECSYYCRICKAFVSSGFRPDLKNNRGIAKGFLSNDIYENGDQLRNHGASKLHIEASIIAEKLQHTNTEEDVAAIIREYEIREDGIFNCTENVIIMAYALIKAGASFHSHPGFMKAAARIGANVGWLQHTEHATQFMTMMFSRKFHLNLIQYLVANNLPFSIMVDSSTSLNQPFLAVFIQTLENGYPVTHFYGLIHLSKGEKSKFMVKSLTDQIEEDNLLVPGFKEWFSQNLVSIVSDAASVMIGEEESFKVHLMSYIQRAIPNTECLNHRLDSAFKSGVKHDKDEAAELNEDVDTDRIKIFQLKFFENFEKSTNEFYGYYASRGHKRWMHFLETAEYLDINPRRFKYLHPIRWSESHFRPLESFHHNYYAMVQDLKQVQAAPSKEFDRATKLRAASLYEKLTDKFFVIVLHEFLDLLTVFKIASNAFQESSSTIVGKVRSVYEVFSSLDELQNSYGKYVKDFLAAGSCAGVCDEGDCTMDMYDLCDEIVLNGVKLVHHHRLVLPYSSLRLHLFSNMKAALRHYMKLGVLEGFEVFNPVNINFDLPAPEVEVVTIEDLYTVDDFLRMYQAHNSMQERVEAVCAFYKVPTHDCLYFQVEWTAVLSCLSKTDALKPYRKEDPSLFWPVALTTCEDKWTTLTRSMVQFALATPYSSSECERGFSVMNNVRTKSRSNLSKETLDAIVRVKINGPDVDKLNAYYYTVEFLKSHARADDVGCNGGRKPHEEKQLEIKRKTRIHD